MGELVTTARGDFWVERGGIRGATPVVFVAGLADDHASWAPVFDRFISEYECIRFDNRGVGRTPAGLPFATIGELAADTECLVRSLEVGPVIAIGSSMGGAICQEWAIAAPDMISALVLSNTWAGRDLWLGTLFEGWIALAQAGELNELVRQCALASVSPDLAAKDPRLFLQLLDGSPPELVSFVAGARACATHHSLERLAGLTMPCVVIAGAADQLTRPVLSHEMAAQISGSRVINLDTGHMTFWERPDEWQKAVLGFLRQL